VQAGAWPFGTSRIFFGGCKKPANSHKKLIQQEYIIFIKDKKNHLPNCESWSNQQNLLSEISHQ
jgi:hypothetical protein